MGGIERGIGEVFNAFEGWLVSTGATASMLRMSWALLSVLWLSHVAVSTRPGRDLDLIGAFARLIVAGGLLSSIGAVTRAVLLGFETFRSAGAAVLDGLIGQTWAQFVQGTLVPQFQHFFTAGAPFFVYPWAIFVLAAGVVLGVALFAAGSAVYLSILFVAHLTLLLAIFLAPLAAALLASPATARWAARWAIVVVRTALLVFSVRIVHAAALYLSIIVPFRNAAGTLSPGTGAAGPAALVSLLLRLGGLLFWMLVGTGIGVYTMLHVERLVSQFTDGVAFGHAGFAPMWLRGQAAAVHARAAESLSGGDVTVQAAGLAARQTGATGAAGAGAQDATVLSGRGRPWN